MTQTSWTYNTNFVCTYKMKYDFDEDDRNILYQMQLLDALVIRVNEIVGVDIDESILDERINELYEKVKNEDMVVEYMKQNPYYESYHQEPLIIFKMLFSYDEFDKFHKVLCNILKKQV